MANLIIRCGKRTFVFSKARSRSVAYGQSHKRGSFASSRSADHLHLPTEVNLGLYPRMDDKIPGVVVGVTYLRLADQMLHRG